MLLIKFFKLFSRTGQSRFNGPLRNPQGHTYLRDTKLLEVIQAENCFFPEVHLLHQLFYPDVFFLFVLGDISLLDTYIPCIFFLFYPVIRLIGDYLIRPRSEPRGVMQFPDTFNNAGPAVLRYVPCRIGTAGQVIGVLPKTLLPPGHKHLHRLYPAALAIHHKYLIDKLFNRSVHSTYHSLF
jgi:hypothetical protein